MTGELMSMGALVGESHDSGTECPQCEGEGEIWLEEDEGCLDPECCSPKKYCPLCDGTGLNQTGEEVNHESTNAE